MTDELLVWLDGELIPSSHAMVPIDSYGLLYGGGWFEGVRAYETDQGTAIFRLKDHLERLRRSISLYLLSSPYTNAELAEACRTVVRDNGMREGYIRPMLFVGAGADPFSAPVRAAVLPMPDGPMAKPYDGPIRVKVSSFRRIDSNSIPPSAKATGQYLNSFLAKIEALTSHYDEPVLLNSAGNVSDGWAHNIFVCRDGQLITPPLSAGALAGLTRASLMTIATDLGIPVVEADLTRTDLYFADECFLTGTAAEIVPVASVDDRPVASPAPGPITSQIRDRFAEATRGQLPEYKDWLEFV